MNVPKLFQTAIDEANEGLVHDQRGEYQKAIKRYLNAVEILNTVKKIHENPELLQKVEEKIVEYLNRAKSLKLLVSKELGNNLFKKKEFIKAIEAYKQVLDINPHDVDVWNNIGLANRRLENLDEAIKAYKKAVELEPQFIKSWINLGNAFLKRSII